MIDRRRQPASPVAAFAIVALVFGSSWSWYSAYQLAPIEFKFAEAPDLVFRINLAFTTLTVVLAAGLFFLGLVMQRSRGRQLPDIAPAAVCGALFALGMFVIPEGIFRHLLATARAAQYDALLQLMFYTGLFAAPLLLAMIASPHRLERDSS